MEEAITLYRPVGPKERELLEQSGFRRWPPRLPEQPIFYPVTNEQYAIEIASRWNVKDDGVGYVTRFAVRRSFMERYEVQKVGAAHHTEWWVPAEDLEQLNDNIIGAIEVIGEYRKPDNPSTRSRTASCSCGQLSIEVQGEPLGVGVCHCLACQRRTGSVFAALASFAAPYRVFGKATEYVRVGDQGAKFTFSFCPVCGTTVFHTEVGREQSSVSVAVGALADPSFPAPQDSVYDCRRHSWVQLPPGINSHEKDPT